MFLYEEKKRERKKKQKRIKINIRGKMVNFHEYSFQNQFIKMLSKETGNTFQTSRPQTSS